MVVRIDRTLNLGDYNKIKVSNRLNSREYSI
jgi:hypothetical protein